MALSDFLQNIRNAASFIAPQVGAVGRHDDERTRMLRSAVIWLTPAAVKGFNPDDFSHLDLASRAELERNVQEFRAAAETVPDKQPATKEQFDRALSAFLKIMEILEPYLDAEAVRAQGLLEQETWPKEVLGFYCESGEDSSGDPALWVWVIIEDQAAWRQDFPTIAAELRQRVAATLRRAGVQRWPFVRFRALTESELFYSTSP